MARAFRVSLSLSLLFSQWLSFRKTGHGVYQLVQNGVTRNWREFLFFQPVCPTFANTHERKTAARKPGDGEGGGWPCVGSRTAIPDMAISHNERQWCPRLETQRGRQLINSSSLVACVMQSFRGPPRLDSAPWSRLRGRLFGGLKNAEADASVDGRGEVDGGRDSRCFERLGLGNGEIEFEESKEGFEDV